MILDIKKISFVLLLISSLVVTLVSGQDVSLDKLGEQKAIKVSGGISAQNRFYMANGIEGRQDPYIWTLSGRLNFSIFGIAVPLSGTLTSQNTSFAQPYNRLSIKPSYKWAKAHIGYSNMTYSTYTLAGHTFLGGGLELNPGKIRVAATYGRFASAVPIDIATNQAFVPSFNRIGYGGKVGYGDDSNYVDFMFFSARDDEDSWDVIPDSTTVFPGENKVLGVAWKFSKVKNLSLSGEFARSAYTTDIRDESVGNDALFSAFGLDKKVSTVIRNAFKFSTSYSLSGHTLSGTYERIDPDYQTMGAYFFNNDMENITAAYATSIFKKKLALSVNGGLQRNNLFGTEQSESSRTIAAGNIVYAQNPFSIGMSFSNYSAQVRYVLNSALDSLNAVVVTKATSVYGTYMLGGKSKDSHVFSVNLSRQSVSDDFASADRSSNNLVMTGTFNYTVKLSSINTDMSVRFNYNKNDLGGIVTTRLGPGVSAKRNFFNDKLTTQTSLNYFSSEGNKTFNALLTGSMQLKSSHTISANISFIQRTIVTSSTEETSSSTSYGETIATINYAYRF
ncbi:MAG: hypothetical protein ABJE80_22240 [Reichenbachiella sp.]|uniref:hypothetical protein n=1 Tax=Reichenbachiella sp. TaxID=2184521 RepID=UPI00326768D1